MYCEHLAAGVYCEHLPSLYCKHLACVYCDQLPGVYCEQGGGDGVLDEQHVNDRLVRTRPRAPVDEAGSGHFQRQAQPQSFT